MKKAIIAAVLSAAMVVGAVSGVVVVDQKTVALAAKKKQKTPSVKKLRDAVAEAYGENYVANYPLSQEELNTKFGLKSSWYKAAVADVPMISAHVDTFVAVRTTSKTKMKKVKKALTAYRDTLVADTMQYPMNIPKIQASRIYVKNNYVFFIMLGSIDSALDDAEEEDQIAAHQEQNQIAVDVIKKQFKK